MSAPFPFCRITAALTPSSDSSIGMELWMPAAPNWNGKFLGVGNGALTGAIWHTSMVRPLQQGYAVANSDLGHTITTANWAFGHPEKVIDYAYRGDHVTAVASKAIVQAFYGLAAKRSYFHGCSNGGHQALMEAQRYPDDYDAIVAGDVDLFDNRLARIINSTDPDLTAFRARGGKLLMWHGWTDTTLEPRSTVNYYNSVVAVTGGDVSLPNLHDDGAWDGDDEGQGKGGVETRRAGKQRGRGPESDRERLFRQRYRDLAETQEFFRLFMAPGVNHCGGGLGPNSSFAYTLANPAAPFDADHDILAALDRWVEKDDAPDRLIATHFTAGVADKTRPVCAYPKIARYRGTGDPNVPESWVCRSDRDRFDSDYRVVLRNIFRAIRSGNFFGLPN